MWHPSENNIRCKFLTFIESCSDSPQITCQSSGGCWVLLKALCEAGFLNNLNTWVKLQELHKDKSGQKIDDWLIFVFVIIGLVS